MEDVERETGLDLSGPTPEDPMEPYYFDRREFIYKALDCVESLLTRCITCSRWTC